MKNHLLFVLFVMPALLHSQTYKNWSVIMNVNDDAVFGNLRPRVEAVSDVVPFVIWGKNQNGTVYASSKQTASFSSPMALNPSGLKIFTADWAGPEMASNGSTLYVAFKQVPENSGRIYVVKSDDGGLNFSDTVRVSDDTWTRFPYPAVDPTGKPYVALMEFDSGFFNPHYAVATSNNLGQTFNASVKASGLAPGEVCDCCPSMMLADASRATLLFRNNDNNLRDIWAAVSSNGGANFATAADIDNNNWMINACPSSGPDGISLGDSLLTVWMSGAGGSSRVNVGTADFLGLNVGLNREITLNPPSGLNQNFPRIAGIGDTIGMVWQEGYQGRVLIKGIFSVTGVVGLLNNAHDTISDPSLFAQKNPDIAFANGLFHIVWQNSDEGKVSYRELNINAPTGHKPLLSNNSDISIYPNPASGHIKLKVTDSKKQDLAILILDHSGQLVATKQAHIENNLSEDLDVSDLKKGLYFLKAKGANTTSTLKFVIDR
jgi:hypothetical protein